MERIVDVAQYILVEYKKLSGVVLDEMKLHKLLYFTQRESIAVTGLPMFKEAFEGWKYGPVCREIRKYFTENGLSCNNIRDISLSSAYIVKNVVMQYGIYESWELSKLSHRELSWKNARLGIEKSENGNKKMLLSDIYRDAEKVRPYDSLWDMYYDEFEDAETL